MKEESKDTIVLLSIVTIGGFVITAFCQYLYESMKVKQEQKRKSKMFTEPPSSPPKLYKKGTVLGDKVGRWGILKVPNYKYSTLLQELYTMGLLTADIERVHNLIVDLELQECETIPNPIVAYKPKLKKDDPFFNPKTLVEPMSFVLQTPQLKTAQIISFTKKWLKSGPRAHIYWKPSEVKAVIVSMGGMVPGVNAVIKQLIYTLQETYGIKEIYGIKHSFSTNKKQTIRLTSSNVKTIHHFGGSYLGISRQDLSPQQIIMRLQENNINQLYIIGGQGTLKLANELHQHIKFHKLNISFCVIPKEITNNIPITQKTIGYETAIEQSQKAINQGYTQSHCHNNGVSIVKIHGKQSGLLAVETCLASRNVQACLVPQFPFELYGDKGLLNFIYQKLLSRSNCTIVVSEGCNNSILDFDASVQRYDHQGLPIKQDINKIIKSQLKRYLHQRNMRAVVKTIDSYQIRASPANAQEMSLSCKFASQSIHCMMAGYTNFMIGSITNKTVMIPIRQVISGNYSNHLMSHSNQWTRLLQMTSQPSFVNQYD